MRRLAAHVASNEIKLIFHAELRPKETNGSCGGKIGCLPSSAAQGGWVGAQRARTSIHGQGAEERRRAHGGPRNPSGTGNNPVIHSGAQRIVVRHSCGV